MRWTPKPSGAEVIRSGRGCGELDAERRALQGRALRRHAGARPCVERIPRRDAGFLRLLILFRPFGLHVCSACLQQQKIEDPSALHTVISQSSLRLAISVTQVNTFV